MTVLCTNATSDWFIGMGVNQQRQIEGKAQFCVGNAFYRPNSRVARDLGVLAAAIYRRLWFLRPCVTLAR